MTQLPPAGHATAPLSAIVEFRALARRHAIPLVMPGLAMPALPPDRPRRLSRKELRAELARARRAKAGAAKGSHRR